MVIFYAMVGNNGLEAHASTCVYSLIIENKCLTELNLGIIACIYRWDQAWKGWSINIIENIKVEQNIKSAETLYNIIIT